MGGTNDCWVSLEIKSPSVVTMLLDGCRPVTSTTLAIWMVLLLGVLPTIVSPGTIFGSGLGSWGNLLMCFLEFKFFQCLGILNLVKTVPMATLWRVWVLTKGCNFLVNVLEEL